MDAFDSIMDLDAPSDTQRTTALSTFLLQLTERMAMRLEGFYSKLAQHSVYHPEMEQNPARTRWNLVRRKIRDGSFFVLTQEMEIGNTASYSSYRGHDQPIELDHVISQIQQSINRAPAPSPRAMDLTEQHVARGQATPNGLSVYESHENSNAVRRMSSFMTTNMRAIRRLSKMPTAGVSLEQLMGTYGPRSSQPIHNHLPTPPSSRGSSRTRETQQPPNPLPLSNLNRRGRSTSTVDGSMPPPARNRSNTSNSTGSVSSRPPTPFRANTNLPTPPLSASATLPQIFNKMNRRQTHGPPSPAHSLEGNRAMIRTTRSSMAPDNPHERSRSMTGPLRALKLTEVRAVPTF